MSSLADLSSVLSRLGNIQLLVQRRNVGPKRLKMGTCCQGGQYFLAFFFSFLLQRPDNWQLDVLICTPSILSKYHPKQYPKIKVVATAGEPTSQDLADLWATHATYWNCCGPTETTIVNTMSKHQAGVPISIGRPTPNNSVYILDKDGRPVPMGVAGVMWAGGHGVTRGYVGLESKTKEAYIPDPFANDG